MDQVRDIQILFAPPPQDASANVIAHFDLLSLQPDLSHRGDLLVTPFTKEEHTLLPWYLEEYWQWPYEGFLERGRQAEALLPQLGHRLYEAIFTSAEVRSIFQEWRVQSKEQCQISIISDVPEVLSLPWELLHDGHSFLALDSDHPVAIMRRLSRDESTLSAPSFHLPLRVLLIIY